jgi:hypothetical protein
MGSWGTPDLPVLLRWQRAGVIGHSVLMATSAPVLAVGLRFPSRRRAAAITACLGAVMKSGDPLRKSLTLSL